MNTLNFYELGLRKSESAIEGHSGYDLRDMMNLYVYDYIYGLRSPGKLA